LGDLGIAESLDSLTYTTVTFENSSDPTRTAVVRALVDTGSTDCDLRPCLLEGLGARQTAFTSYQTAAGLLARNPVFSLTVRANGREAVARVNASDEEAESSTDGTDDGKSEDSDDVDRIFGFKANTDDAVLGCDALGALGLLVDCKTRRLVELPSVSEALSFTRSAHVVVEFLSLDRSRTVSVTALVDTGCTDMDLSRRFIDHLDLPAYGEGVAQFETAGGVTIEAPIFRAVIRLLGREAEVRVSPSEESGHNDDDALLGHDALAALGVLVDCSRRRLVRV